jgi:glycosyltransferase involved in cell wall biosynthesis
MGLVSLIVPVYNSEAYLERCIEALLKQDYPEIEIILVDDGSADNSGDICDRYAKSLPDKIRVVHQKNSGASIARKNGINMAKGKYVMFADSDDFVSPHYVSTLYNALVECDTDISLCPMKRIGIGEKVDFDSPVPPSIMPQKELLRRFFKYEFWGYPGGCYKKDLFNNLTFPIETVNEDYFVKAQMFITENAVAYIDTPLYFYEQHPLSLSKQTLSLRALGEFDNASATWEYVCSNAKNYSYHALAIVSEVACKWLGALRKKPNEYIGYRNRILRFIKGNFCQIMVNPHFLWKLKIVILKLLIK